MTCDIVSDGSTPDMLLTCANVDLWQTGATPESVSQTFKKLTPQKSQAFQGPSSGLRSLSSHFSSRFWSSARPRCGPRCSQCSVIITAQSLVQCRAVPSPPSSGSARPSAQLSSAPVQCACGAVQQGSRAEQPQCSTRLSLCSLPKVGWLAACLAGTSPVLCVLCRPFPGPPRSGLRCFAGWIIHICCPLALECNLKTSQLQP